TPGGRGGSTFRRPARHEGAPGSLRRLNDGTGPPRQRSPRRGLDRSRTGVPTGAPPGARQEPELGAPPHGPLEPAPSFPLEPRNAFWSELEFGVARVESLRPLPWFSPPHPPRFPPRLATPRSRRTRSSARWIDAPSGSPEDTRTAPCGVQRTSTSAKSGDGPSGGVSSAGECAMETNASSWR